VQSGANARLAGPGLVAKPNRAKVESGPGTTKMSKSDCARRMPRHNKNLACRLKRWSKGAS